MTPAQRFSSFGLLALFAAIMAAAPAMADTGWVGGFSMISERAPQNVCAPEGTSAVSGPVTFGQWDRTRAQVTNLCFEVYVQGITDQNDLRPGELDVAVHAPFKFPARFVGKRGNNYLYALDLKDFDPLLHGTSNSGNTKPSLVITPLVRPLSGYLSPVQGPAITVVFSN